MFPSNNLNRYSGLHLFSGLSQNNEKIISQNALKFGACKTKIASATKIPKVNSCMSHTCICIKIKHNVKSMTSNGMTRLLFRDPEQDHIHLCLGIDTYAELKTKHNCWNHKLKEKTKQQLQKQKTKMLKNNTHK